MRFLNCVSSNNIILAATVEHPYFSSSSSDKFISLNSDSSNFFLNCYTSNNIFIAIMTANPDFSSIPSNVFIFIVIANILSKLCQQQQFFLSTYGKNPNFQAVRAIIFIVITADSSKYFL